MRLLKLKVKNFRAIGEPGVDVSFDKNNIVLLIGPNNAGKSTLLHAYDYFVTAKRTANADDFHHGVDECQSEANPQSEQKGYKDIEIEAWIKIENDEDRGHPIVQNDRYVLDGDVVRVRKIWKEIGKAAQKETFDKDKDDFDIGGSGGMDTLLQNACPDPVWISGFSSPEEIEGSLQSLVKEVILKRLSHSADYQEKVRAARKAITDLRQTIADSRYVGELSRNLQSTIHEIFPNISITLIPEGEEDFPKILDKQTKVKIQDGEGPFVGLEYQGHGIRRQFILSSYRGLSDPIFAVKKGGRKKLEDLAVPELDAEMSDSKSKMLLVEEPELFLHPSAMRAIRRLLYELAETSEFQALCSTHSPIMIDLARPHTSLVRVNACVKCGAIAHQMDHNLFVDGDRDQIKMLNFFDPYVCEAFFANRVILVEGDTEVIAIRTLLSRIIASSRERRANFLTQIKDIEIELNNDDLAEEKNVLIDEQKRLAEAVERENKLARDAESIHVVNCSSKANIPFFQKVLRSFCIPYFVFHDLDSKFLINKETRQIRLTKDGQPHKNPAWSHNQSIWKRLVEAGNSEINARRYVFERDFESANYVSDEDWELAEGKPFAAYNKAMGWNLQDETIPVVKYLWDILGRVKLGEDFAPEWLEERSMPDDIEVPGDS